MKHPAQAFALLLLAVAGPHSSSVEIQAQETIRHELVSEVLGDTRVFTVRPPVGYDTTGGPRYPVLYLLDGETNLGHAVAVTEFLAENGLMPEVIVVGVHAGSTRNADYLPENPRAGAPSGDAEPFLAFLEGELVPFIEREYAAAPLRLISGHSFGGVFVTYAATVRSGVFRAFLTQSPFLDEAIGTPLIDRWESAASEMSDAVEGARDAYYFANLGDEPDLVQNFDRVTALIDRPDDSIRGATLVERGATHMTTRLVGLYDGLQSYFAELWPIDPSSLLETGADGFISHLDSLDERFGYSVRYSETAFQSAAQLFLTLQRFEEGTVVASRYVEHHPDAVLAHFLLGSALAGGGDIDRGVASIERAIALYEADPTPALAPIHQAMLTVLERIR